MLPIELYKMPELILSVRGVLTRAIATIETIANTTAGITTSRKRLPTPIVM
jgi:hypothetical protein